MTFFFPARRRSLIACAMVFLLSVAAAFPTHAADASQPGAAAPDTSIYAVVHVDIEPRDVATALPLLTAFAQEARRDPAVLHIDILQQTVGSNHFTLVEALRSEADYRSFVERPYVKAMRTAIQPFLGSPFDERLHHRVIVP